MNHNQTAAEYAVEAIKSAPPVAVAGFSIVGLSLQDWVYVATLVYTVLQVALLIRKFIKERNNGR